MLEQLEYTWRLFLDVLWVGRKNATGSEQKDPVWIAF